MIFLYHPVKLIEEGMDSPMLMAVKSVMDFPPFRTDRSRFQLFSFTVRQGLSLMFCINSGHIFGCGFVQRLSICETLPHTHHEFPQPTLIVPGNLELSALDPKRIICFTIS
jgi:hypothetical protein